MALFVQTLINGVMLGSIYAMVALGLTLIFSILEIPNFAHGALYMIGAYVSFMLISSLGLNYWLAMAGSMLGLFIFGMLVEKFVYRPFYKQPPVNMLLWPSDSFSSSKMRPWRFGADISQYPPSHPIHFRAGGGGGHGPAHTGDPYRRAAHRGSALLHQAYAPGRGDRMHQPEPRGRPTDGHQCGNGRRGHIRCGSSFAAIAATLVAPISLVYPTMGVPVIGMAFVIIIIGGWATSSVR